MNAKIGLYILGVRTTFAFFLREKKRLHIIGNKRGTSQEKSRSTLPGGGMRGRQANQLLQVNHLL